MATWIIVDVGCIECGEQTEVRAVCSNKREAQKAFDRIAKELSLEEWQPRGGFLEMLGLHGHDKTTYMGGTGYSSGGQHSLEVHRFPPRKLKEEE